MTKVIQRLTQAQLQAALADGHDVSLRDVRIYDLRATASFRLMGRCR